MRHIIRNFTTFLLLMITSITSISAQVFNIYFDFNSDVLRINDVGKLQLVLKEFNPNTQTIFCVGHTDTVGNKEYNLELSKRRTNTVKEFLIKKGVNAKLISTDFKGKLTPVKSQQFYNRRVEVYLISKETNNLTFSDFRKSLLPKLQKFTVSADYDIEIEGNQGTIVKIPAKSFVTKSGKEVTGVVEIRLMEFYSMKDFFSKRLSTISNGNLLTSAGMLNINAVQNGEALNLRGNKDMELAIPKSSETKFFTFYGEIQENGSMNWQPDKRQISTGNPQNTDNLGWAIAPDGNSLIITENVEPKDENQQFKYDLKTGTFGILTEEDKRELKLIYAKQIEEQQKIDSNRDTYYNILQSNRLGFINCDQFVRNTSVKNVDYRIEIENRDVKLVSAVLFFRRINSFLEVNVLNAKSAQIHARLPLNEDTELMLVGTKDNRPYFYHQKVQLTPTKKDVIELSETTYKEIQDIF